MNSLKKKLKKSKDQVEEVETDLDTTRRKLGEEKRNKEAAEESKRKLDGIKPRSSNQC